MFVGVIAVGDQPKLSWQPHGRVANPHGKRKAKEVGMSWQAMRLELAAMRLAMRQQQRRKHGVGHVKSSHGGTKLSTGQQLKGEYWAGSQHTHEASSTFCFGV
ncbi:unnamed protein product [Camellia sinensis]